MEAGAAAAAACKAGGSTLQRSRYLYYRKAVAFARAAMVLRQAT